MEKKLSGENVVTGSYGGSTSEEWQLVAPTKGQYNKNLYDHQQGKTIEILRS